MRWKNTPRQWGIHKQKWRNTNTGAMLHSVLQDGMRNKYWAIFEAAHDAIFIEAMDGRILDANPAACDMLGYTQEELLQKNVRDLLPPEQNEPVSDMLRRQIEIGGISFWGDNIRKDGTRVPVEVRSHSVQLDGEQCVVIIVRDITARKKTEKILQEVAQGVTAATGVAFFHSLVEHLANALDVGYVLIGEMAGTNNDMVKTVASCARGEFAENMEYFLASTLCEDVAVKKSCCYPTGVCEAFPEDGLLVQMGVDSYIRIPLVDSAGRILGIMAALDSKPMQNPELVASMFQIFACRAVAEMERINAEKQIHHLAFHDPITNLPNRRLFYEQLVFTLEKARENKQMVALLYLDLDMFKRVNDTQGHAAGDSLLNRIAEQLSKVVEGKGLVARMGGDEFAVSLPAITKIEDVCNTASQIIKKLQQPWFFDGRQFYITTSMGITLFPIDGEDVDSLLKNADVAMYHAKEQGGNEYQFYTKHLNDAAIERVQMEHALCHALNHRELVVYYQPKVTVSTGEIVGMEALVRWQYPEKGLISPAVFIPLAEETGLIIPMGIWILRTACAQNKKWQDVGYPPMRVAVNISARQFQEQGFVEMVRKVLAETQLDPCWLELEVTESIAMCDVDVTLRKLSQLQEMGIHIALDDFGTGYSSLGYLKHFSINSIKVAQAFVRDIITDPHDAALVTAIIAMGHSLNLEVVAEGVETEEQLVFLKCRDCDLMQGYLFAEPMPADQFEDVLKKEWGWAY